MSVPPPNARWYDVPAGTRAAQCSGENCKATIYWIVTPAGRKMPVDCDVDGGHDPSEKVDPLQQDAFGMPHEERDGRGVSHFQTCVDVERFSGRSR